MFAQRLVCPMVPRPASDQPTTSRTYEIAGLPVRIEFEASPWTRLLERELAVYPGSTSASDPALTMLVAPLGEDVPLVRNPATHLEFSDGFTSQHKIGHTRFVLEGGKLTHAAFSLPPNRPPGYQWLYRWASMQYLSEQEQIGQAFHEKCLQPALALLPGIAPVHASAFQSPTGQVTLIGGTGGVGKTSLELELCLNQGYAFVADDFSFVSETGHVWPNLSFPKIYGYNVVGDARLKEKLLSGRPIAERLHWTLHMLLGPNKVRRRLSPRELYATYSLQGGPLQRYVILARGSGKEIAINAISPDDATALSMDVIQAEMSDLLAHLRWHEYNSRLIGQPPQLRAEDILHSWKAVLSTALSTRQCYAALIPYTFDHKAFKRHMVEFLGA